MNSFFLQEILDELVNSNTSLMGPLMKLNQLGRKIKNQELIAYTKSELSGYELGKDIVPEYRKSISKIEVTFQAGYNTHTKEVSFSMLQEPYNKKLKYLEIGYGITILEQMLADRNKQSNPESFIYTPVPMEMLHVFQIATEKLYKTDTYITVTSVKVKGNAYKVNEIVSAVRQKVQALVMDIADEFGYELNISSFKKDQEKNNQVINNFMETNITVTGHGNAVNAGNNSSVSTSVTINHEDQKYLQGLGVEVSKANELNEILEANKGDKRKLGEGLRKWLGEVSAHVTAIGVAHNFTAINEFVSKFF